MHAPCLPQVVDQILTSISSSICIECLPTKPRGDLVHLFVFECLPQVVGDVEHHPLQEQHEGDPLVVSMDNLIKIIY